MSSSGIPAPRTGLAKEVHQYSLEGNYIASYKSGAEASRITGVSKQSISNCLNKISKSAGKFLWVYHQDNEIDKYSKDYHKISVCQYNFSGEFIEEFKSRYHQYFVTGKWILIYYT